MKGADPARPRRVVITGIGTINALGEGREPFWEALRGGRSGITPLTDREFGPLSLRGAGVVRGFEASKYVPNRKSLKVMCRDIRLAVAASYLACRDAGFGDAALNSNRAGVSIGAGLFDHDLAEMADCFRASWDGRKFDARRFGEDGMSRLFPLWLLKYLPNMPACHITIAHGLRGPSNTITVEGAGSAAAFEEAFRIIRRGSADIMFCGGAESRINPAGLLRYHGRGILANGGVSEPVYPVFSSRSDGIVPGEGAALLVLEEMEHALRRGARVFAEIAGAFSCVNADGDTSPAESVESRGYAMANVIGESGMLIEGIDVLHLSSSGISEEERFEARAVEALWGPRRKKPALAVTKPLTGFLGYASAATEIAIAAMAIAEKRSVPSAMIGDPILGNGFEYTPAGAGGAALVNHFVRGLSNHAVVLKFFGGPS